jgi:glutamate dehydrogenase/leucine dehydrogenase
MKQKINMVFEDIKNRIEEIGKIIDLKEEEKNILLSHKRIKKAILEINGKKYDAWRIVHNNSIGPGKGGIRYHPGVNEDEVKSLSFWMSLKNSLAGLPYGGAKGGVTINPKEETKNTLEKVSREYIKAFHEFLGQDIDIPAPDVYTNSEIMGWMLDEFEKIKNKHEPSMITGKPLDLQGCPLRGDATAKGGFIILKEILKKIGKKDATIAIQGFGNAGLNIAKMLYEDGMKIIAVSDSKGGILNKNGLDIKELADFKENNSSVTDYPGIKISNKELLETEVDILILAALENQITSDNVNEVKAKYILELANGPVNAKADEVLFKKGVRVIPDILANSGGVVVSYFEWAQNRAGNILDEEYLKNKLDNMMKSAFEKVYELSEEKKIDMRKAAYIIAIKRILGAEKARGNLKN